MLNSANSYGSHSTCYTCYSRHQQAIQWNNYNSKNDRIHSKALISTIFYIQNTIKVISQWQCNCQQEWKKVTHKHLLLWGMMMATDLFKLNLWIERHITCVTEVLVGFCPSCIWQLLHAWGNLSSSYRSRGHLHCWSPSIRTYQHHWSSILSMYHISHLPRVASLMR